MAYSKQRGKRPENFQRRPIYRIESIEKACLNAWWSNTVDDADMEAFHSVATPPLVYALIQATKAGFNDLELQELKQLLDELMNYVKLAERDSAASDVDRNDLILRARELRSRFGI
jgi:hypothetical protein